MFIDNLCRVLALINVLKSLTILHYNHCYDQFIINIIYVQYITVTIDPINNMPHFTNLVDVNGLDELHNLNIVKKKVLGCLVLLSPFPNIHCEMGLGI